MRKRTSVGVMVVAVALALCAVSERADAMVIIQTDVGTIRSTAAMTGFQTQGDDMVGMEVTALFAGGSSEKAIWAATGPDSGAATGTTGNGWSLSVSGDTYTAPWTLYNNSGLTMEELLVDGTLGKTVFDRTPFPTPSDWGTPGSAQGRDFTEVAFPADLEVTVTYTDALALGVNPPVLDEWVILDVEFTSAGDFPSGSRMVFQQDTDNATTRIVPQSDIPEPATMSLLALGGLGILARRRKKH